MSDTDDTLPTREGHLDWCKRRALEYVDLGMLVEARASLVSDLSKHPDTKASTAPLQMMKLTLTGKLDTAAELRTFIEGIA